MKWTYWQMRKRRPAHVTATAVRLRLLGDTTKVIQCNTR